jgi:charged multivesicular body protein 2A
MGFTDMFKRKTPAELIRENKRMIDRAIREMDRERVKMEQQEKKVIADIKKTAKTGQMDAVKVMAKDLVRTRQHIKKFMLMRANMQAVSLKMTTMKSQHTMAQSMKGVTKAMGRMNKTMNMPQIQKIMAEFQKQSEMMDDAIDDAMDDGETEEDTEQLVGQILGELGIEISNAMNAIPETGTTVPQTTTPAETQPTLADDDIEARLMNLKRND